MITESLRFHGQYRPIVADPSGQILAGNHTWRAAKDLGWDEIAVVVAHVTDKEGRRIMLADNRTTDLGWDDSVLLAELLGGLPDLEGTGYDEEDLKRLIAAAERKFEENPPPESQGGGGGGRGDLSSGVFKIGKREIKVDVGGFAMWAEAITSEHGLIGAPDEIRRRLALPSAPQRRTGRAPSSGGAPLESLVSATEMCPIDNLRPWPDNPRHADEIAIAQSLSRNGQYRPLVARDDGVVIIGSATLAAARRLGWTHMSVVRVNVDDEEAAKMRLMDNRSAALASYDDNELALLLEDFTDDSVGTGYEQDELEQMLLSVGQEVEDDGKSIFIKAVCSPAGIAWSVPVLKSAFKVWEQQLLYEAGCNEHLYMQTVLRRLEFDGVPVEE